MVLMAVFLRENGEAVKAEQLDEDALKAVNDPTRRQILELLTERPSYPSKVAEDLGITKQKTHYHFNKLKENGLIEKVKEEKHSGGLATYYKPVTGGFIIDIGGRGDPTGFQKLSDETRHFLNPLIKKGQMNGKIVVGSPDRHGPDQVRGRDGHLAGEIGLKLGRYTDTAERTVLMDTELVKSGKFQQNLLLLGGVLTNTVSKKYNDQFPVSFEGEEFPYREIKTSSSSFTGEKVGVIAKTKHPENKDLSLFIIAGVRNKGTEAAVAAFKNLENHVEEYMEQESYIVVRGQDIDGDGEIDDYQVLEKEGST